MNAKFERKIQSKHTKSTGATESHAHTRLTDMKSGTETQRLVLSACGNDWEIPFEL